MQLQLVSPFGPYSSLFFTINTRVICTYLAVGGWGDCKIKQMLSYCCGIIIQYKKKGLSCAKVRFCIVWLILNSLQ